MLTTNKSLKSITDALTVNIQGKIDGIPFTIRASGDATRISVSSNGFGTIMNHRYWKAIHATCAELQPAGNNQTSMPTRWFLATTANPPAFVNPKHRLLLRVVHLICLEALSKGASFCSNEVFSRTTPSLQVERNVLESPDHWEPPMEVTTTSRSPSPKPPRSRGRRGRKRRRRQRRRYESESSDDESSSSESSAPHSSRKRAKVFNDPTPPPPKTALIKYTTRNEAMQYLNEWSDPEALVVMPHIRNSGLMLLMGGATMVQFQGWMEKFSEAWLDVKKAQLIAQAQLPLEQAKVEQEEAKKAQEEERSKQEETKRKANLILDRATKRQAEQDLWKLKTAEKQRQEKEFRELQKSELERKELARDKMLSQKRQTKLDKREDEQKTMELDKEAKLAAIAVETAAFELARKKERPGRPMKVAPHGLPEVPNVANVVAAIYEGKTGIITCQEGGCSHSVMMFAPKVVFKTGAGAPLITCTPCAEAATASSSLTHRSDLSLTMKRIYVWMTRHGFKTKSPCQLCEQGPEIPLHGGWECLHDIPVQKVVNDTYKDRWIGESPCNMKQGTSRINEFRQIKHGLGPVDRTEALVVNAGCRESRKALSFALDHRNSEKQVRAKLRTLLPRSHGSMTSFLVRRTTTTTTEELVV